LLAPEIPSGTSTSKPSISLPAALEILAEPYYA